MYELLTKPLEKLPTALSALELEHWAALVAQLSHVSNMIVA